MDPQVIKSRYQEFMKAYENCKKCVDCEACDEAEVMADEILSAVNDLKVEEMPEDERKEIRGIILSVSSIFDQLRKARG